MCSFLLGEVMLDLLKNGIKAVGAGIKTAKVVQAKANALMDDIDLDGKPEWKEIEEKLPLVKEKAIDLFEEVKALGLLVWGLALHVAGA